MKTILAWQNSWLRDNISQPLSELEWCRTGAYINLNFVKQMFFFLIKSMYVFLT